MSKFLTVHHLTEDPNTHEVRIARATPYIRLGRGGGGTPLFLKEGQVCDENGKVQSPVPQWVWAAAAHCSDTALKEAGFDPEVVRKMDAPDADNGEVLEEVEPQEPTRPLHWRDRAKQAQKAT